MHEALLYDREGTRARCRLCPHRCVIVDGACGICGVRENRGGTLHTLVYGRPCALNPDPIEKKPLYHFLPGTRSYSIATVGCNMRCMHCQNWEISQSPKEGDVYGRDMPPEAVVDSAVESGCESIAYTYTEPTVFMEYALDTAKMALDRGLRNVFVSNGYMTSEALDLISPYLHGDNVDLKSFSDKFYRETCGATLEPVLETLKGLVSRGIWVEVTTLIIPTLNDSPDELKQIAEFIAGELGEHVPWHVSRFHPDYKLDGLSATDVKVVETAVGIGKDAGLKHVYAGNVPHGDYENTYCPECGALVIERHGFTVTSVKLDDGKCPSCGAEVEGVWA